VWRTGKKGNPKNNASSVPSAMFLGNPRNIADGAEEAFFFELLNRQKELGLLFSPFSTLAIY